MIKRRKVSIERLFCYVRNEKIERNLFKKLDFSTRLIYNI